MKDSQHSPTAAGYRPYPGCIMPPPCGCIIPPAPSGRRYTARPRKRRPRVLPLEAFLISTALVALAEMGDKTQLLSFVLAAKLKRRLPIALGILAATAANHFLAGWVGAWLATLASPTTLRFIVAASFFAFGLWALKPDRLDGEREYSSRSVFLTTLVAFFLVEMGDKTQLATVALAARFDALAAVVIGTSDGGKAFNATIALEASFSSSGGLSVIALRGDGCMMCDFTDRAGAQVRGRVDISYDFGRSIFDGRADVWINVAGGVVQGIGPEGLAGWMHMHSEPSYWFFKLGEPDRRVGVRLASIFEINAYLMVGENLPPPPPPPARVLARLPEYRPVRVGGDVPGDGFAMGASLYFNTGRIPFLIFYARMQMELGFDVALMDYGAALKKREPNPGRRSASYSRQSRFEGSHRQVRAAILHALSGRGPLSPRDLGEAVAVV